VSKNKLAKQSHKFAEGACEQMVGGGSSGILKEDTEVPEPAHGACVVCSLVQFEFSVKNTAEFFLGAPA